MVYGWVVVACAFMVALCGWGFGFYGPGIYLASLRAQHGWSATLISSAITVYYLCGATWILFAGDAIHRVGPRAVVLVGVAAMGLGVALIPMVSTPWLLFPLFIVMSLGWAAMSGAAVNAIVAPWFERRRGAAVSLALNGASCGGVFVAPYLVYLITRFDLQRGLAIGVGTMLAVMVPVLVLLRRSPEELGLSPDGDPPGSAAAERDRARAAVPMWNRSRALRDRAFLTISIAFAAGLLAQVGFLTHQMSYLVQIVSVTSAAVAVSLTTIAAVVGRTLTGLVIDRLDTRAVSATNFALEGVALAMLVWAQSMATVYVGCVLLGLAVGNMITLPSLIVQREFPPGDFSRLVSLIVSVNQYTFAFGPALLGALRDWSGDYRLSFLVCVALQLAAAAVILVGRRREPSAI